MNKQPYKQLYTPRNNPELNRGWVPGRAYEEDTIADRRSDPNGSLILKLQAQGFSIGNRVMQLVHTRQDIESAHHILAPALFNSGSFTLERRTNKLKTSRTVNDIHQIAKPDSIHRDSPAEVRSKTILRACLLTNIVQNSYEEYRIGRPTNKTLYKAGRYMGNIGLAAGLIHDVPHVLTGDDFEVQNQVRESGMRVIVSTHEIAEAISVAPSIAQLADRNSPLATYWNNVASNGAYDALQQAQLEHAIPARW